MDIEIVFLIVAIIFYIAMTILLLKLERKELKKMSIEKLKKKLRGNVYFIVFLVVIESSFFFLALRNISLDYLELINVALWGFLMIYFWLLYGFIIKRIIKQREDIEDK